MDTNEMSAALHDIGITVNPQSVFMTGRPGETSYAEITIIVSNNGQQTESISGVSIQLPANLYQPGTTGSVIPSADETWDFGSTGEGAFEAVPDPGNSNTLATGAADIFSLEHIMLGSNTGNAVIQVTVMLADGTAIPKEVTVQMIESQPGILYFNAQPTSISPGQSTALSWASEMIDSCILTPAPAGYRPPVSGSISIAPKQDNTTYTLDAFGPGIHLQRQVDVTIMRPQVITFNSAGSTFVDYGESIALEWSTLYADSVQLTANPQVPLPASLPVNTNTPVMIGPLTQATTFVLTPVGNNQPGTVSNPAQIDINPPSAIFTSPTKNAWQDDPVELEWEIRSAASVTIEPVINNGPSLQKLKGSVGINPNANTNYKLTVTGAPNTPPAVTPLPIEVTSVQIKNFPAPQPVLFTEEPNGNQVTLSWECVAQKLSLNNGIGDVTGKDSITIQTPPDGAVYELTAGTMFNPALVKSQVTVVNNYGPFMITHVEPDGDNGLAALYLKDSAGFRSMLDTAYKISSYGGWTPMFLVALNNVKATDGSPITSPTSRVLFNAGDGPMALLFYGAYPDFPTFAPLAENASLTVLSLFQYTPPGLTGTSTATEDTQKHEAWMVRKRPADG